MIKTKIKILSFNFLDITEAERRVNKWIEENEVSVIDIKFQKDRSSFDFMIHYFSTTKRKILTEKIEEK